MTFVKHVRDKQRTLEEVYSGRPSMWGNPYKVGEDGTREEVIEKFKTYALSKPGFVSSIKHCLKGMTLLCYCKPLACHGDVLAAIAEGSLEGRNED